MWLMKETTPLEGRGVVERGADGRTARSEEEVEGRKDLCCGKSSAVLHGDATSPCLGSRPRKSTRDVKQPADEDPLLPDMPRDQPPIEVDRHPSHVALYLLLEQSLEKVETVAVAL